MTVHDRSDPGPNEALDEPEQQVGELAPDASPPMEAEVVKPVRRRRKRTRFAVPERTAVAVRSLWEQASEEEIVAALDQLALREERIYQATHDLHTKKNQ